ncbi:MAG TPA: hypothetical protein VNL71_25090 [Chloroflexota bacterium]|nr:hypothetical protein [Chloroflexota bacterium]
MSSFTVSVLLGPAARGRQVRRILSVRYAPLLALLLSLPFPSIVAAASGGPLLPAPLGQGMCQAQRFADGSVQAQIAVKNATCVTATTVLGPVADHAHGAPYTAGGFTCKATVEGAGSSWAAAWGGAYYAYTCASGGAQAAFNWGRHYIYGSGGSGAGSQGTGTLTFTKIGHHLLPSVLGQGMCQARSFADGSVQAQIAVYNTTCTIAAGTLGLAADRAHGGPYTAGGYICKATVEGAGSLWVAAWSGAYYAYSCAHAGAQAAFNWGRHYTY